MKRQILYSIIALAGLAGLAGCAKETPVVNGTDTGNIKFTATISAKDTEAVKSLDSEGNTAWEVGEKIGVYYLAGSSFDAAIATVTSVDSYGNATITATLTDAMDSGRICLVYPAWLHDGKGNINSTLIQYCQTGNLTGTNGISDFYDVATGEGTLDVSNDVAGLASTVTMTNPLCICKFKFYYTLASGAMDTSLSSYKINHIVIEGGGRQYMIYSDRTSSGTARDFEQEEDIYLAMYPVSNEGFTFTAVAKYGYGGAYTKYFTKSFSGVNLENNKFYGSIPSIALAQDDTVSEPTITNCYTGTITSPITVSDGETIILNNVTSNVSTGSSIVCEGNATITLIGTNTLTTSENYSTTILAGGSGTELILQGSGSLVATASGDYASGIGGAQNYTCGDITIRGGTITANGGYCGSGIGAATNISYCGNITILDGTVTASGGSYGAGIGSGYDGRGSDIIIQGGTIYATGGKYAAGIGSGYGYGTDTYCGAIKISGGTITATGGEYAAGIGGGYRSLFASVDITSGITSVTAIRGANSSNAIGKGVSDKGSGDVTIDSSLTQTVSTSSITDDTLTLTPEI